MALYSSPAEYTTMGHCVGLNNESWAILVLAPRFRFFGTLIPDNEIARRSAYLHSQGPSSWRGNCDTCGYLSSPWSSCEFSVWATQLCCCYRPFWTWTYLETITWQIASYSPALACVSQWCGHYFGWFQYLWSRSRTIHRVEPDIHWWWPEKDCHVPLFLSTRPTHSSKSSEIFCYHSRSSVKRWVWSPPELPVLNRPSMPSLPRWRCLQQWNGTSTPLQQMSTRSLHAYATLKRMQSSSPVVPTRQDRGTYLDIVTVPQPLGPGSQGRLMTVEIQGVDLILSQALRMKMHEVPSCYGSLVNNTALGLRIESIIFGKSPT